MVINSINKTNPRFNSKLVSKPTSELLVQKYDQIKTTTVPINYALCETLKSNIVFKGKKEVTPDSIIKTIEEKTGKKLEDYIAKEIKEYDIERLEKLEIIYSKEIIENFLKENLIEESQVRALSAYDNIENIIYALDSENLTKTILDKVNHINSLYYWADKDIEEVKKEEKLYANEVVYSKLKAKEFESYELIMLTENYSDDELNNFIFGVQNNANIREMAKVICRKKFKDFENLINSGKDGKISATIANIQLLENYNISNLETIIEATKGFGNKGNKVIVDSDIYDYFFRHLYENEIERCAKYAQKINFNELTQLLGREYSKDEILRFINHHAKFETPLPFTKENLTFKNDLTEFLSSNYVDAKALNDILTFYPQTSRNVGKIPEDWLDKIKCTPQEAKEQIYKAILEFSNSYTHNTNKFGTELSVILGKNVKVKEIDEGEFGVGYLINIDGCKKTCLKIYKTGTRAREDKTSSVHGPYIEPQIALFANKHYGEDFAKMHFGNLGHLDSNDNKAFMLVEFLEENGRVKYPPDTKTGNYKNGDAWEEHNKINGIIYDFGAIHPLDENNCYIPSWHF